MVTQVNTRSLPYPDDANQTSDEFSDAMNRWFAESPAIEQQLAQVVVEVNEKGATIEALVGSANAKWVAGTFAQGDKVWSPTDYLDYRCKNAGVRNTDPAADPTNWQCTSVRAGNGGADVTSSAVDVVLTALSSRLQIVTMTAADKKVTLPAATSLTKGSDLFVFKNNGIYRFSIHKNGGGFLCYCQPGQIVRFGLSDISTASGVWHPSGFGVENVFLGNAPEVLTAFDAQSIAFVNLTATKGFAAFRNNTTGFIWGCVINFGSASGTAVAINAESSTSINIAAQTASQVTIVYKAPSGIMRGLVVDISGNTFTPGAISTIDAVTNTDDIINVAALSSTKVVCVYRGPTAATTMRERVIDIATSAFSAISAEVVADTTGAISNNARSVETITATKFLVGFRSSTNVCLRLQSVAVSVPAPTGTLLTLTAQDFTGANTQHHDIAVLDTNFALVVCGGVLSYADMVMFLVDISGTTPVLVNTKPVYVGAKAVPIPRIVKLDANNAYIGFTGASSDGVDGIHVRITNERKMIVVSQSEKVEPGVTNTNQFFAIGALDATHVTQVCRNASTFLSAKTIEIAP